MSDASDLWLRLESDDFSVSCPRRFRHHIRLLPADHLVGIDGELLRCGVFVGSGRACTLRLESLSLRFPQFVLRLDSKSRWHLTGFGGEVFHNRYDLAENSVILEVGDSIACETYHLRVITAPDANQLLQELVEKAVPPRSGEKEFADEETDFQLNLR